MLSGQEDALKYEYEYKSKVAYVAYSRKGCSPREWANRWWRGMLSHSSFCTRMMDSTAIENWDRTWRNDHDKHSQRMHDMTRVCVDKPYYWKGPWWSARTSSRMLSKNNVIVVRIVSRFSSAIWSDKAVFASRTLAYRYNVPAIQYWLYRRLRKSKEKWHQQDRVGSKRKHPESEDGWIER